MAEACRIGSAFSNSKATKNNQEEAFCVISVFCVFISLITILADLTTDLLLLAEYWKNGQLYWAIGTFIFIIKPNIIVNIFSMRWTLLDKKSSFKLWITHGCLVGLIERYIHFLYQGLSCKKFDSAELKQLVCRRNDLSLLHYLYIFTGTVPQIIVQLYAIISLDQNFTTKVFALSASSASVIWACGSYIYSITSFDINKPQWQSMTLKLIWNLSMLMARLSGILLFIMVFGIAFFCGALGLHWAAMTFWIVTQKTTFCPNKLEETFYNLVMGFVYCFCYINLREGHSRYRLMIFYTLMVTQNFGSLFLYVLISDTDSQRKMWSTTATICVVGGTLLGLCSMVLYYRWFHERGPITWRNVEDDVELNNKVEPKHERINKTNSTLGHARSFKSQKELTKENGKPDIAVGVEQMPQTEGDTTDNKFLLDHWIVRSATPTLVSAHIENSSINVSSIEFHTVQNTPQTNDMQIDDLHGQFNLLAKKKGYSLSRQLSTKMPVEDFESSIDEITSSNLNLHKRRGICSLDELRDSITFELASCTSNGNNYEKTSKNEHGSEISQDTDGSNKKTSSDSIDMDLDLSFSDINSSDINTFNENIVQKLCLSALKNIKVGNEDADIENIQRIALDILKEMYAKKERHKINMSSQILSSKKRDLDTPTEVLSVHDYENICAVNIAREAFGLRSWNGYSDIENWVHDGSVFRDRRRDTLTSGSSEISSCISQDLKNFILSAPPFPKRAPTYSNVFIKFDRSSQADYVNTVICNPDNDETYLAKPCMVDLKDPNQLEPIIEELDDLGDIDTVKINKKRLNSESSLVATIDEIRKATVNNSPSNLYHRRAHLWDSPDLNSSANMESNLKRALWKEPCKLNPSNIMECLPEKENILNVSHGSKSSKSSKDLCIELDNSSSSEQISIEPVSQNNRSARRRQKSLNMRYQNKKINNSPENEHDLHNKNFDLLWKLVTENSFSVNMSREDLNCNQINSSLQSLIAKDVVPPTDNRASPHKIANSKKGTRCKPRRKFSILRERFEPRFSTGFGEDVLCQSSATIKNQVNLNEGANTNASKKYINLFSPNSETGTFDSTISKTIKEKRNIFMRQVLSPPKFNTKLKHKV